MKRYDIHLIDSAPPEGSYVPTVIEVQMSCFNSTKRELYRGSRQPAKEALELALDVLEAIKNHED